MEWKFVGLVIRAEDDNQLTMNHLSKRYRPSLLLWMMFLQSRSLWQSTTGEPSVERCSFIHTISCSNTALLGTSCWILDRDTERKRYQSSECSDNHAYVYKLLLAKTKSFSLFFFFLSSQNGTTCAVKTTESDMHRQHTGSVELSPAGSWEQSYTETSSQWKLTVLRSLWLHHYVCFWNQIRFLCLGVTLSLCVHTHASPAAVFILKCALFCLCAYEAGFFNTVHSTCVQPHMTNTVCFRSSWVVFFCC